MRSLANAVSMAALAALFCSASPVRAAEGNPNRPKIDLVFAVDTTGSMGGLIQAAKTKVWSIINQIASGKPTPEVRVGLVAYRDRGDVYVTQVTDLTPDLDAMYTKLMAFQAGGGGDTPESVNQALSDAVNKISWSQGKQVMRLIFLVGDAPPHMDYQDDVKYPDTAKQAVLKGITIHTIRCGNASDTEQIFKDIAHRAEGRYFSIEQGGGAVAVATPFDGEIGKLDGDIRSTTILYGGHAEREASKRKMADESGALAAAPAEAKAEHAVYAARKSASGAGYGGADLVSAVESNSVAVDKLSDDSLPDEMKKLSPTERKAYVEKKAAERKAMQAKLDDLNKKRSSYLAEQAKKGGAKDSFDANVLEAVKEKSDKIGVSY
jgi:Mg-chelatase subunit ChlD